LLKLYNTLTRTVEEIRPRDPARPLMYTCGPTVYRDAHIGNLRSYLMADWIRRALERDGVSMVHVKNITDVGHMRQEELERGEDKVIAAALAEGKRPSQIASLYTERFLRDEQLLNILPATHFPKATEHVGEMIEIVRILLDRGVAYEVDGNVYFEVGKFPGYGSLSGNRQDQLLEAVRVEADPLKRDPRDFTLWKAAEPGRLLKWPSPWGEGFPGWHIECSAMSRRYLGERLDLHTGGVDNIFPHHEGELAQSEAAFGRPYVRVWVHGQHLLADGVKMAKSAGNSYILADLVERGIEPLAFRYLCATARFRTRLNFTFAALKSAQRGYTRLRRHVEEWSRASDSSRGQRPRLKREWRTRFWEQVDHNLGIPQALAIVWSMSGSELNPRERVALALEFDRVLGLGLAASARKMRVPVKVKALVASRQRLRQTGRFGAADRLRDQIREAGFAVQDDGGETRLLRLTPFEAAPQKWPAVSASSEVPLNWGKPDACEYTVAVQANGHRSDLERCVASVFRHAARHDYELLVLDNAAPGGIGDYLDELQKSHDRTRVIHADLQLGEAAAKNVLLRQALGRITILLETHMELSGDLLGRVAALLAPPDVGVAGPFGVRTDDLHHFHEVEAGPVDVDAMQAYCFAFKRSALPEIGHLPESYRFYRNLDLDFSFRFRDRGYRIVADPGLPVRRHEHRAWTSLTDAQREEASQANFRRFARRWGKRTDLLVGNRR
jgi:cysteinyl-tRNA synthetase